MNMPRQMNARQLREHSEPEVQNEGTNAGDFVIVINQMASISEDTDDVETTQAAANAKTRLLEQTRYTEEKRRQREPTYLQVGDVVYVRNHTLSDAAAGVMAKLNAIYKGPLK